ncbi:MAG: hypothetical protein DKT66_24155 [Candidatus Melainabacteria bacterium]|nr:MAG: hypothetical protein DKT66_24155 [Candidatus Melainabacteria bacterium]
MHRRTPLLATCNEAPASATLTRLKRAHFSATLSNSRVPPRPVIASSDSLRKQNCQETKLVALSANFYFMSFESA